MSCYRTMVTYLSRTDLCWVGFAAMMSVLCIGDLTMSIYPVYVLDLCTIIIAMGLIRRYYRDAILRKESSRCIDI